MGVNAFDSTGGLLHDVKIVDLCTRMAAHKHGELFITCRNDNCVYVFSLNDGSFLREFGKLGDGNGEFSDPRGITVDSMGRLWVADSLNARIQILDRNGAFLGSRGGPSDAEGRAQTIDAVLCNQDTNEVFVSDVSSHRIHVFSGSDGAFLRRFGRQFAEPVEFSGPCALAADSSNNLLVADEKNKRVQVVRPDGTYITEFACGFEPLSMCVSEEGFIFVGGDSYVPRVHVFAFQL